MKKTEPLLPCISLRLAFIGLCVTACLSPKIYSQPCSDLFISEVLFGMNITNEPIIESTTVNHAIEIYNPTNGDINLSNYKIELTTIDNLVVSIDLEGTLNSKKTFVVSNAQSTIPILSVSDLVSLDLDFNDITVLKLVKNDTIVLDKIGNEGPSIHLSEVDLDSLKYPDYAASININMGSLENIDLRRDALIREGQTVFVAGEMYTEWALYLGLEFSNLGIHECACAQPVLFFYGVDPYLPEEYYPEGIISRWCQVRITEPLNVDITISLNYHWHHFVSPNVPGASSSDIDWHAPSLATDLTWVTSTEYNDYEIIDEVILDQLVEGEEGSGLWLVIEDANGTGTTVSTINQYFDFVIFDPQIN